MRGSSVCSPHSGGAPQTLPTWKFTFLSTHTGCMTSMLPLHSVKFSFIVGLFNFKVDQHQCWKKKKEKKNFICSIDLSKDKLEITVW